MKPDSTTTKIRVVFDGSFKTSSGISLNEVQHVGPTVQDDLFSIVYKLNTVTYGTAAAPYLATQCLWQLGEDSKEQYLTASKAIISDFYVNDLLTGADSLDEARTLKNELMSIFVMECPLRSIMILSEDF